MTPPPFIIPMADVTFYSMPGCLGRSHAAPNLRKQREEGEAPSNAACKRVSSFSTKQMIWAVYMCSLKRIYTADSLQGHFRRDDLRERTWAEFLMHLYFFGLLTILST